MGLDMYLYERVHVSKYGNNELFEKLVDATGHGDKEEYNSDGTNKQPRTIEYEVGYWRKANAIHNWFVENVQHGKDECVPHPVQVEDLQLLRHTCQQVIDNPDMAMDLLPPTSGFFFGGTDVDDWYFDDLEETIKIIDNALENAEKYPSFVYCSSW